MSNKSPMRGPKSFGGFHLPTVAVPPSDRRRSTFGARLGSSPGDLAMWAAVPHPVGSAPGTDLVWWSGLETTVVDLQSGNGFDFGGGSAAASGDLLVVTGFQNGRETLSSATPSTIGSISSCSR